MAEEHKDHKGHKEEKKAIRIVVPKFNPWILISLVLALVLVLSLINGWNMSGKSAGALSIDAAAKNAVDYINNNLVESGTSVSLVSTEDLGTVYMITVSYQGNDIPTFVTKDAGYLFVSAYNTSQTRETTSTTPTETPKTDKPVAQLYVM